MKNSAIRIWTFLAALMGIAANLQGTIDFLETFNKNIHMNIVLTAIQSFASLLMPFIIGYITYMILKVHKRREEDTVILNKMIKSLGEEIILSKTFNQIMIEEYISKIDLPNMATQQQSNVKQENIKKRINDKLTAFYNTTRTPNEINQITDRIFKIYP